MKNNEDISGRLFYYTEAEELANRWSHGLGTILSLIGAILLIMISAGKGDIYRVVSVCIYGIALVTFYSISTAYHSVRRPYPRYVLRILDHASIYLMIAGSYTPFTLVTLRGPLGWLVFGVVWGLAVTGAVLKIYTAHRMRVLGPFLYIGLGWSALFVLKPLMISLASPGLVLLFAGGATYTLGVIFYLWERLPYNHAIWHLFVLTGSVCHFLAILFYVI